MAEPQSPKVSAIITTYNRASLLPRAVNSVLSQTLEDYEVIIVDDASSDDTQQVIAGFNDPRIRSFRHEVNRGQSAAFNTAITQARGEYITFLDDDDEWPTDRLNMMAAVLDAASPRVGLVYGWCDTVDDSTGQIEKKRFRRTEGDEFFEEALLLNLIGNGVLMTRTSVVKEVGGYDEDMILVNDWDFVTRVIRKYDVALCPAVVLNAHRNHGFARISEDTPERRREKIAWLKKHMERFASEYARRPRARATLLRRQSITEMKNGNWREGVADMAAAFMADPLDVSRAMLSHPGFAAAMLIRLLKRLSIREADHRRESWKP